jgi:hypothetical protein
VETVQRTTVLPTWIGVRHIEQTKRGDGVMGAHYTAYAHERKPAFYVPLPPFVSLGCNNFATRPVQPV